MRVDKIGVAPQAKDVKNVSFTKDGMDGRKVILRDNIYRRWVSTPVNEDTYGQLLAEYSSYLQSNVCDDKMVRSDIIAVLYKGLIEKFNKWLRIGIYED